MKLSAKKIVCLLLPLSVFLVFGHAAGQETSQVGQPSGAEKEVAAPVPDLADIVPLVAELNGRLAELEIRLKTIPNVSEVEQKIIEIEVSIQGLAGQLQRIKDSQDYRYNQFIKLNAAAKKENSALDEISKPISQAIRQLGVWKGEWSVENKRWNEWQSLLLKEEELNQLNPAFEKANHIIATAQQLVLGHLEAMLKAQEKTGGIQANLTVFVVELDRLSKEEQKGEGVDQSPHMFSFQYVSQLGNRELWIAAVKGLGYISWPDSLFLTTKGWIVFLQIFLTAFVIIAVYRNRQALSESTRWRFVSALPISVGLFFGFVVTVWFYEYGGIQPTLQMALRLIGGIAFVRLIKGLTGASWKTRFVYGLLVILITNRFMHLFGFPLPLFRLYRFLVALIGLVSCLGLAKESIRHREPRLFAQGLRLTAIFLAVIAIMELWGNTAIAAHFLESLTASMGTTLVILFFLYMMRGILEWLFRTSFLRQAVGLENDERDVFISRVAPLADVAVCGLILIPSILVFFGVYDNFKEAIRGFLSLGFDLGSQRISVGLVIASAAAIYGSFLVSWIFQRLLISEVVIRGRLDKGVQFSIGRLVHYFILLLGFLLALSFLGFDVTKFTIILSALGVGIGFGLQGVVNNFVSGLILLFERPVRVGDFIEIQGKWAEIKRIGIRATTVQTIENADMIIPNADLVNNQVTNWTLSDRQVRVTIPVGVAYGSDVPLVMKTLMSCAEANAKVAKSPEPQVLFMSFGESSLDFELRLWVWDADERVNVKSDIHQAIDRSFREAKIEIAFPQRDLHLRGVDGTVFSQIKEMPKSA